MSNGNDTPKRSSRRESKTGSSTMHQSGEIYLPSMVASLKEWLTSLRQGSPASPILLQDKNEGLLTIEINGLRRSELSVRWDRDMSYWKTCQVSFLHLLTGEPQRMGEPWSESLPPSGTVSTGERSELRMWAHPTVESVGGALGSWMTPNTMDSLTPKTQEALDHEYTHREGRSTPNNLRDQVSVQQGEKNWPTPTSTQHKGWSEGHNRANTNDRLDYQVERPANLRGRQAPRMQTGGSESSESGRTSPKPSLKRLNPSFVEWMMGVPIGWTSLKPLEMGSYQRWWQSSVEN
jgi:hypothetical protein